MIVPGHQSRRGFSMIELLVSIAIIAVLSVLIFSAASKFKETGNRAVCVSNLKQIAGAWQGYLADNHYLFPEDMGIRTPMPSDGGAYGGYWMYGGGGGISSEKYSSTTNRWLSPYLEAGKVWRCPSDGKGYGVPGVTYIMYGNSYAWNYHGLAGHGNYWNHSALTMTNKTRKFLVADAAIFAKPPAWPSYKESEAHSRGPNAYLNMAFVDGHVAMVQDDESKTPKGQILEGSPDEARYRTRDFDW